MNIQSRQSRSRQTRVSRAAANLFGALAAIGGIAMVASPAEAQHYHHAGTVESARLHGWADIFRAAGDYNLRTAKAASEWESARSANLRNRLDSTETYFEQRRMNKQYRAAERSPRLSSEQLIRIACLGVVRSTHRTPPHHFRERLFVLLRSQRESLRYHGSTVASPT